jgi:hypothetical protein
VRARGRLVSSIEECYEANKNGTTNDFPNDQNICIYVAGDGGDGSDIFHGI